MKRKIFFGIIALTALALGSCTKGPAGGDEATELAIKVYSPVKVLEGQVVTINGTRLNEVTEVKFPGGVSVTEISHLGDGQISVITPAGVADGELSVKSADAEAFAHVPMTVGAPSYGTISHPEESQGPGAWITTELLITGTDLEFIKQAKFPAEEGGYVDVNAIDFVRKANNILKVKVPYGIAPGEAKIELVACNNQKLYTDVILLVNEVPAPPTGGTEWIVAWEGDATVDGGAQPSFPAELFGKLRAGETLRINIANNGVGWGQVYYGDWSKMIMEIPGGYPETSMEMVVTQEDVDKIKAVGILAQGAGWNVIKIEYSSPIPIWVTAWEGEASVDGGQQPSFPASGFSTLAAGETLRINIANNGVGWGQVYYGDWSKQIMEIPGGFPDSSFEMVVTQEDVDKIKQVGILAQGAGWSVTKIEYSAIPPKNIVVWEGDAATDGAQPVFNSSTGCDWSPLTLGSTIRVTIANNGVQWLQFILDDGTGTGWNWPSPYISAGGDFTGTEIDKVVETQEDVDSIVAHGMIAQGGGFNVLKLEIIK
jgi:hypothetical protein